MEPTAGTTLEYDRRRPVTPMAALHYVALVCALGPMIVGVLAFLLYVATRHEVFALPGFLTLLGGCAATFVGGVCLATTPTRSRLIASRSTRAATAVISGRSRQARRTPPASGSATRGAA